MIEAIHLEKRFFAPKGNQVTVLGVDRLEIAPGQHMSLVGPSGSGKSTILSMVGGMLKPTSGDILWNGKPWPGSPGEITARERARRVGYVFQDLNLLPGLTLFDNLVTACWILGLQHPESLVRDALQWVGLSKQGGARPECLSRGERQRAAVARAVIYPHKLILADEPTASLDIANAERVMDLLIGKAAENGSAMLVATHDPRVVGKLPNTYDLLEHSLRRPEEQGQPCGGASTCCVF